MTPVRDAKSSPALGGRGPLFHLWGSLIPIGRWFVETVYTQMISPVDLPLPQVMCVEATVPRMWWQGRRERSMAWLTTDWKASLRVGDDPEAGCWSLSLGEKDEGHVRPNGSTHPCTRGTFILVKWLTGWQYSQARVSLPYSRPLQGGLDETDWGILRTVLLLKPRKLLWMGCLLVIPQPFLKSKSRCTACTAVNLSGGSSQPSGCWGWVELSSATQHTHGDRQNQASYYRWMIRQYW